MKAFFDSIALGFESMGVHPVLGAFLVGAVIAFVFARRRSTSSVPAVIEPAAPAAPAARPVRVEKEITRSHAAGGMITFNGRTIDFPPYVMAHIHAGNKVEAIKALRDATGMELTSAKQIVDKIAELPAKR